VILLIKILSKYLPNILEYAKAIKLKAEKGELSDTEYLDNILGMTDSIVNEAAKYSIEY